MPFQSGKFCLPVPPSELFAPSQLCVVALEKNRIFSLTRKSNFVSLMAAFEVGTLTKQIMKRNLGMFFGLPLRGMGVALLAFCTFIPVSRASVTTIVNNTADTSGGFDSYNSVSPVITSIGQLFTMPVGSGGEISSLTLVLGGTGSTDVYVYNATTANGPSTELYDLGRFPHRETPSPCQIHYLIPCLLAAHTQLFWILIGSISLGMELYRYLRNFWRDRDAWQTHTGIAPLVIHGRI